MHAFYYYLSELKLSCITTGWVAHSVLHCWSAVVAITHSKSSEVGNGLSRPEPEHLPGDLPWKTQHKYYGSVGLNSWIDLFSRVTFRRGDLDLFSIFYLAYYTAPELLNNICLKKTNNSSCYNHNYHPTTHMKADASVPHLILLIKWHSFVQIVSFILTSIFVHSQDDQAIIEASFLDKQKRCLVGTKEEHRIKFSDLTEKNRITGKIRKIRRRPIFTAWSH